MKNRSFWVIVIVLAIIHFHNPAIFHRSLIEYDDTVFIAPIGKLGLIGYFKDWLFKKEHLAFPLRDFTFWIDFHLSAWTGIQFFWITNWICFVCIIWVLRKTGRLIFPSQELFVDFLIALLALHPTMVEVIQWASIRKHLLAILFVTLGTERAIRLKTSGKSPMKQDYFIFLLFYIASLLSYLTGVLWLPWLVYYFRDEFKRVHKSDLVFLLAASFAAVGVVTFVIISNSTFSTALFNFLDLSSLKIGFDHWVESLGRGFFNWLVPIWVGIPYYLVGHPFSWIGLATLGITLYLILRRLKHLKTIEREKAVLAEDLLFLSLAGILSSSFVLFQNTQFIWTDHYAFLPFPYFIFACALMIPEEWKEKLMSPMGRRGAILVLSLFAIRSAMAVTPWKDDLSIMRHCAKLEGSPPCIGLALQKGYDQGGCLGIILELLNNRKNYSHLAPLDYLYAMDVPFYDGLCIALLNNKRASEKEILFKEIETIYGQQDMFLFSKVLLYLRDKDINKARDIAYSTYLAPHYILKNVNEKGISLMRGQAEAICSLTFQENAQCRQRVKNFRNLYQSVAADPHRETWGTQMSLSPFMKP